ncbi:MAG: winged helix-turn-helix domain-containing protein [Ignisphaera sp.]|uniref:Winged helix-turn-helix domain-containing protein n=1 Tax=Ignisphaera aggregans TaxID=334771 RepID=A0A7J3MXW7_9CREN
MFFRRKIDFKILEYLKAKGKVTDRELYDVLSKEFNISYNQLLSIIMQLEIEGFISVAFSRDYMTIMLKKILTT